MILTHVWNDLKIEVSKSPDIQIFVRFKDCFESLAPVSAEDLELPIIPESLSVKKQNIITICKEAQAGSFARGDYKELVDLMLLYLGEGQESFDGFIRPGALHKARWMAKLLYAMKIVLLRSKIFGLPKGAVFSAQQSEKLQRFILFSVFCYVPWWLTSPVASACPLNDLNLIKALNTYKEIDSLASSSGMSAFSKHLWYLTEELLPLVLFCSSVDNEEKSKIVEEIKQHEQTDKCKGRVGTEFGKPKFPDILSQDDIESLALSTFAGKDSWGFFRILRLDTAFLDKSVESWKDDDTYLRAKEVVDSLAVVNDSAERGVKLCHDFLTTAKKDDNLQNILQVVENNRNQLPNQKKRTMSSKNWFLKLQGNVYSTIVLFSHPPLPPGVPAEIHIF